MTFGPATQSARRRLTAILVAAGIAVAALVSFPELVRMAADWYWFQALGYQVVFLRALGTKALLAVLVGAAGFAFFYFNLRLAQQGVVPDVLTLGVGGPSRLDLSPLLRRFTWLASALLALPAALAASASWLTVLRFLDRTPFGVPDPAFGRDVGYYVFTLPLLSLLLGTLFTATLMTLLIVTMLYFMRRDIALWGRGRGRRITIERSAEGHLGMLAALLLLVLGAQAFLVELPALTYSTTGPLVGASYSDLGLRAPVLRIAGAAALAGAVLALVGARRHRLPLYVGMAAGAYLGVRLLGAAATGVVQRLVVSPNELARETPQLGYHIAATRAAWGLDDVEVRDLSGEAVLSAADIAANPGTIRNVRLWDRDPLLQTFGQIQAIRTYYDFVSVDDDRYWIDGEYRQVLLSPRELNPASLPTRTFINEHLTFTHGMGLTLSPVNQVTGEGLPVLLVKDLPPASTASLRIERPAIYFGELSSEYVFVNTRQQEFDYPAGEENAFTSYAGRGGVQVSSFVRRLVLSIRFRSLKILFSSDIGAESRAMYHRTVLERAEKALPFLRFDADPYMVITDDGRLVWILDAYTASSRYPYSQPVSDGTNYMRNSVKVVIDAYDGDVRAYNADPADPLLRTYQRIFPGLIQPLDSMAPDVRAHIRYPSDLFRVQSALYATFHMREPAAFYHREDQWQIPVLAYGETARDPFLRHIIMKLPGEAREEYILMAPFTPRQKDNLAAWMVGRSDGEHYGRLVVYRFPRQSLVFGPTQVVNRINQDTEISRQVSLWDQRGSQVIRGNLLVIPIEESLIYVQALYLRAEGGRIPELKRVIVSHQNRVVMEETLEQGLARLFGDERLGAPPGPGAAPSAPAAAAAAAAPPVPAADTSVGSLIRSATAAWERAVAAQRSGDWARYGEEMRQVGELLRRLRERAPGPRD